MYSKPRRVFAESALPLLKHRKLSSITQEACIRMPGKQPNLPCEAMKVTYLVSRGNKKRGYTEKNRVMGVVRPVTKS